MIVHIHLIYNLKHPHTWEESLYYVYHSYNRALHISTGHNPFQVGLGFQPFSSIDVSSEVEEQMTPTKLNPDYIQKASNDHIVDRQINGTRQQRIQFY
jgi:hypothetical protein